MQPRQGKRAGDRGALGQTVLPSSPFSSLMVAYWLLASGQEERLHSPVRLYSLRQKFCVFVLQR